MVVVATSAATQEEEHREHPCNGIHAVGILLKGDKAHGGAAVQHIPLTALDLAHLLLGIVQLGKAIGQLLFGIGLPALVLGAGIGQLLHAVPVFLPALVQPGASRIELGVGCGRASGQLQLPLQKLFTFIWRNAALASVTSCSLERLGEEISPCAYIWRLPSSSWA